MESLRSKEIEGDIIELKSEVTIVKTDLSALQSVVANLAAEVAALRDTVDTIERSAKVVTLRGGS